MNKEKELNDLLQWMENRNPITINYGKGYFTDKDVKDYATWDEKEQKYRDTTGLWSMKLLLEIARGEVENTKIEMTEKL